MPRAVPDQLTFIAINGLVGLSLAPNAWLATLPVTGYVAGPNLASATRDALPVPFAGAYAALVGVALLALLTVSCIEFPPLPLPSAVRPGRPLREIAR